MAEREERPPWPPRTPEEFEAFTRHLEAKGLGRVLNPRGDEVVSRRFVERLGELAPSSRRLAIAMACAQPWRDEPEATPECYRVELDYARWVAEAEYEAWAAAGRPGEGGPGTPQVELGYLFAEEPEPILGDTLQILADHPPLARHWVLMQQLRKAWDNELRPEVHEGVRRAIAENDDSEFAPEWVRRDHDYARAVHLEQMRPHREAQRRRREGGSQ